MFGELFLIRHAKAQSRELNIPDFDRTLTEKGIARFTTFLPEVNDLLKEKHPIKVWTSPVTRAKETAKLLTDALELDKAVEKKYLQTGDFNQLLKELQAESSEVTVVCVGHEPTVSMWTEEMTGEILYFPIGGLVQIAFTNESKSTGKLVLKTAPNKNKSWD